MHRERLTLIFGTAPLEAKRRGAVRDRRREALAAFIMVKRECKRRSLLLTRVVGVFLRKSENGLEIF